VSEFLKIFETTGGVTVEQLLAFAALIVPGFISLRVYDMRRGGEGRKVNEALIDVIVYSFVTDSIAFAALWLVSLVAPPAVQPAAKAIAAILILLCVPVALAFAWLDVQQRMMRSGIFADSAAKLLESVLDEAVRNGLDLAAIITLRDGRKIAGRIGASESRSRVTDDELLLGEVWTVDQECATFLNAVKGSVGIVVSRTDCQSIELVRWADAVPQAAPNEKDRLT
jgi:hypothetical protein